MKINQRGHIIRLLLVVACCLLYGHLSAQSCQDATGIISLSNQNRIYVRDQLTTRSGHRVYCGWIGQDSDASALLLCHNAQGEVQWAKSFKSSLLSGSYFYKVTELRDGNIIVSGEVRGLNGMLEYLMIAKFDAAGNFLWHRVYKPGTIVYDMGTIESLQVVEDDLGTVYFSFCDQETNFSAIARIDASGNMLWSHSFRYGHPSLNNLAIKFIPVSVNNDTLYLAGTGIRDQYTMKLNRHTGELQSVNRFSLGNFSPGSTFPHEQVYRLIVLPNGHIISIIKILYALPHQFFVVEWDEQLKFVKAFSLDKPEVIPQEEVYSFSALPDGTIIASTSYSNASVDLFFDRVAIAALNASQQQIVMQKKVLLRRNDYRHPLIKEALAGTDQNGQLILAPAFTEAGQTTIDIYTLSLHGKQMECGAIEDTSFVSISPQTLHPIPFSFDEIQSNVLMELNSVATVSNETFTHTVVCKSVEKCDSLTIKGPALVCAGGEPAIFTVAKNQQCGRNIIWDIDPAAIGSLTPIDDTTICLSFTQAWQGALRASLEGCGLADTFSLTVQKPLPVQLAAEKTMPLCIGQNDTLTAGNDFLTYHWQDGSGEHKMIVRSPGTYWVHVTDTFGCESADTVTVTALVHPPHDFIFTDTTICQPGSIQLEPEGDFISWRWSTGETTPAIKVMKEGIYTLAVTDRNHCTGDAQITVKTKPCPNHIYFPNAFSPNGDGRNDVFKPVITGNPLQYRLSVYNRWGQKVFETTHPALGWNGSIGSVRQPAGIYVWQASVTFAGEAPLQLNGTIVLIK